MNNLVYNEDYNINKILYPMLHILDEKNIIKGITIKKENEKLYICLDRNCLSESNQLILEKISYVYSETLFYSDNNQNPNADRLEYWCPDEDFDKRTHITERCRNKKMFVLELDYNDEFTILGTSIMLANVLEEQDPVHLKVNDDLVVLETDIIERQKRYILSGYPDLRWINLNISLNDDNPLRMNPYAPFSCICEINSPVSCDNMIFATMLGYNEKIYKTFCMESVELEKAIKQYFERQDNNSNENKKINGVYQKLLKK